jgi:hypothetical protein
MGYQVGDVVFIKKGLDDIGTGITNVSKFTGQFTKITRVVSDGGLKLEIDKGAWYWNADWVVKTYNQEGLQPIGAEDLAKLGYYYEEDL